jgi:hypothetical protein
MDKIDKRKTRGVVMTGIGFLMLLANALAYIFDWNVGNTAFTVLGLVFVVIGLKISKK